MKTLIAIPCMDMIHTAFVQCLMQMDTSPLGQVSIRFQKNTLVYDGRNILCIDAVVNGYDKVLWLDSDITFPRDMPRILIDAMQETGADMVTGIYVNRHADPHPVLYSRIDPPGDGKKQVYVCTGFPDNAVFPVAGAGFGCVLTKTSMLQDILDKHGPPFSPLPWASEDISFCWRANQIGKQIVATSRMTLGHVGQYEYTVRDIRDDATHDVPDLPEVRQ